VASDVVSKLASYHGAFFLPLLDHLDERQHLAEDAST